MENSLRLLSNK